MKKIFFLKENEQNIIRDYILGEHIINFPQDDNYIYFFKRALEKRFEKSLLYTCFGNEFTIIFF